MVHGYAAPSNTLNGHKGTLPIDITIVVTALTTDSPEIRKREG